MHIVCYWADMKTGFSERIRKTGHAAARSSYDVMGETPAHIHTQKMYSKNPNDQLDRRHSWYAWNAETAPYFIYPHFALTSTHSVIHEDT